ncbi:MAG: M20/M25/M40 family metallo-hydrolase [Anaerolineaceae bacterium]
MVLTIPGVEQVDPHELILSTHLDDLPDKEGHGAEDNGVGVAALLEMARVLRYNQFNATIKLIWFTGEEQGRRGSTDYVQDNTSFFDDLIGVINLDMFGYDADDDGCFEIHAGNIPASYVLGDCLVNVIDAYDIPLAIDYIKEVVPSVNSDQLSFWMEDLGAIEILENHFSRISSFPYQQCGVVVDANPYTHTTNDTIENSLDIQHAFDIVKASLAASVTMAGPLGVCFNEQPFLNGYSTTRYIVLSWQNMGKYATYRLSRSLNGCEGPWEELADNISDLKYNDTPPPASELAYQIEAIAPSGACRSLPSNCATNFALSTTFLPIISK